MTEGSVTKIARMNGIEYPDLIKNGKYEAEYEGRMIEGEKIQVEGKMLK